MRITHRYSGIDTALRCLRRYKIEYIDQLQQEGETPIELAFGSGLHAALQASLEGADGQLTFNTYWDTYESSDRTYADLGKLGLDFIRKFDRLHKKKFDPRFLEHTLRVEMKGLQWEGTPDFLGYYNGEPAVVDWKTSGYHYLPQKILSNPQMPLYAAMAKKAGIFEAKKIVYYVFVKGAECIQVQETELTKELLDRALETCESVARDIETRPLHDFGRNPGSCQMGKKICPWFNNCFGGN